MEIIMNLLVVIKSRVCTCAGAVYVGDVCLVSQLSHFMVKVVRKLFELNNSKPSFVVFKTVH